MISHRKFLFPILTILLLSLGVLVIMPSGNENVQAWGIKPDDNVNGTYIQFLEGNWYVSQDQTYTDEIIDLTGDLIISDKATLTLKNTMLRMNSTSDGEYGITVERNSFLEVLDGDGLPGTWGDESILTDSVLDIDNFSSFDYGFIIELEQESHLKIRNSKVDNLGGGKSYNGIYGWGAEIDIQNTTISRSEYGIRVDAPSDLALVNNTFKDIANTAVRLYGQQESNLMLDHCTFENASEVHLRESPNVHVRACDFTDCELMLEGTLATIEDCTFSKDIGNNEIFLNYVESGSITNCDFQDPYPWPVNIYDSHDIAISDCDFTGDDEGLEIYQCQNITLSDCAFDGFSDALTIRESEDLYFEDMSITNTTSTALDCYYESRRVVGENIRIDNSNVAIYMETDCNVTLYNSSIESVTKNLISWSEAKLTCINTTMDMSPSMFTLETFSGPGTGTFFYNGNFLHTWVSDTQGSIPNALVTCKNTTGAIAGEAYTDQNGQAVIAALNLTVYNNGAQKVYLDHDPFTVSATINGQTQAAGSSPTLNKTETIFITYGIDTKPGPPNNLETYTEGTDIVIDWDCYYPDYYNFMVYRNTTSGFALLYDSKGKPDQYATRYVDPGMATNYRTYRYYVHIVDAAFQQGNHDVIVQNGDWVIANNQTLGAIDIELNGTLKVLKFGSLTLKGTDMAINYTNGQSEPEITVDTGGSLSVLDVDNNPLTDDGAYIHKAKPELNYTVLVESDGTLVMRNSLVEGYGHAQPHKYENALDLDTLVPGFVCKGSRTILNSRALPILPSIM